MNRPEESLQRAIVHFLTFALPKEWIFWATPNQRGTRTVVEQKILRALGVRAGVPDLFVLGPGPHLIAIEVKAPPVLLKSGAPSKAKPVVSDAQQEVLALLAANGVPILIARSIDDVEAALRGLGVPLKTNGRAA